jgi:toxin-antitoxin system PIN domain toxin
MFLLDINILIALADADHEHHARARTFFATCSTSGWATCPLTENCFVRILGAPSYPELLNQFCTVPGHHFWPDDITLRDLPSLPVSKHLTDHYLLALAVHRQGKLATMDERIDAAALPGGKAAYFII